MLTRRLTNAAWVCLLCVVMTYHQTTSNVEAYNLGVGKHDITGPAAEIGMMGYAEMSQTSAGILNRLYARAFVIEDEDTKQRVVIVNCDLLAVMQLVHQDVIQQLKAKYNGLYSEQNVVLHAIHTHAGPGGYSAYFLYDFTILGFIEANYQMIVSGIVAAIDEAHANVAPGKIKFSKGVLPNSGKNRSPPAYDANPEAEKTKYGANRDSDLRLLQFYGQDDKLRGLLGFYPVHGTSLTNHNHLISGDNKGYAEFKLEEALDGVVAAIGISNAGDVSPNLIDNGDGTFRGPGKDEIESTEIIGGRQSDKVLELIDQPSEEVKGPVVAKLSYVDFANITLHDKPSDPSNPYATRTCPAVLGQNFGAGTEDGRGLASFTEGSFKENPFFVAAGWIIKPTPQWAKDCHTKNKIPLLAVGFMDPVPWAPQVLPVQVVRIGQFAFAAVATEITTMAGRRIRETLRSSLEDSGVKEFEILSISNGYAQYTATKEEYLTQNYEGASTLFGPNQLDGMRQEVARVAASVADPSKPLDVGPTPRQFDRSKLVNLKPGVVMDTAPLGKSFGGVEHDAKSSYAIGSTVVVDFYGAHPNNRLSEIASFCDVEQKIRGTFVQVMEDSHWDVRYKWSRKGISDSRCTCEWFIRAGSPKSVAGEYRIRHRGFAKSLLGKFSAYEGVSSSFTVQ